MTTCSFANETIFFKYDGYYRTDNAHGFPCRTLLHLAYGWWSTVLHSGINESVTKVLSFLTPVQIVAPAKYRRFLSYLVGWCVMVGEVSTSSNCALNSAQIVAALVEITHPEIEWKVCFNIAVVYMGPLLISYRLT